jgi:proteasome accessory factor C
MAERETADARISRVLQLLPRAARPGGIAVGELAAELGVTERRVLEDLEEVCTRAFYHSADSGGDVQVMIGRRAVEVFTTRDFRRPPRLTPREMLALGLGLRILAAEATEARRPFLLRLAERLETGGLGALPEPLLDIIAVNPGADSATGLRAALADASRGRRRCVIAYLKPKAAEPERRTVDPYVLMAAEGKWYLVAFCHRSADVRVFRADRVADVEVTGETFAVPEGFDPWDYVREGRVYRAGETVDEVEVPVRYSARIARWIEELGAVEPQEDGAVVVRHRVSDPGWLVRHVLEYGADAEVLGPPEMRRRVAEAVVNRE